MKRYFSHHRVVLLWVVGILGMLLDWATLPMLIMWPIMAVLYHRLAKKEEGYMLEQFGNQYVEYSQAAGMFLPLLRPPKTLARTNSRAS